MTGERPANYSGDDPDLERMAKDVDFYEELEPLKDHTNPQEIEAMSKRLREDPRVSEREDILREYSKQQRDNSDPSADKPNQSE